MIKELTFKPANELPTINMQNSIALLFNPCDGYHIADQILFDEDGNFEGFYDFCMEQKYKPHEFYVAWAILPKLTGLFDDQKQVNLIAEEID